MAEEENKINQQETSASVENRIFDDDEFHLVQVDPDWDETNLLEQKGIFFLKDVAQVLNVNTNDLKRDARKLEKAGSEPWEIMGIRKTWTHWQVRMKIFAPYFRKHRLPKICTVDPGWDANYLLAQKGRFHLTEVCKKIPFTTHQIRYQVRRAKDPRNEYGVWKDDRHKAYLVDMERFSAWMKRIWLQGEFY